MWLTRVRYATGERPVMVKSGGFQTLIDHYKPRSTGLETPVLNERSSVLAQSPEDDDSYPTITCDKIIKTIQKEKHWWLLWTFYRLSCIVPGIRYPASSPVRSDNVRILSPVTITTLYNAYVRMYFIQK